MFKNYVRNKLEKYVRQYFLKHPEVRLVVVAGSVGKTSAEEAIATVLSGRLRVRFHERNEDKPTNVPMAILGIVPPDEQGLRASLRVLKAARKRIKAPTDVDVIVTELTSDHPSGMAHFSTYLRPDIGVITAVAPEHLNEFANIETIAQEEIAVANFSKMALINRDDISGRFANFLTNGAIDTYGTTAAAEYRFEVGDFALGSGYKGNVIAPEFPDPIPADINVAGEHSLRPTIAAAAVAAKLGFAPQDIAGGLSLVRSLPGRMNVLRGVAGSMVIDDTYEADPITMSAALQTLYAVEAPQRIALLGSMKGLGMAVAEAHKNVGELCDSSLLAWVVTVGEEAETYLAPAARLRGCQVKSFKSAIEAGGFVHGMLDSEGAVILASGGHDDIFLEEAVKVLLHETEENHQLVRQSSRWLHYKDEFFSKFS